MSRGDSEYYLNYYGHFCSILRAVALIICLHVQICSYTQSQYLPLESFLLVSCFRVGASFCILINDYEPCFPLVDVSCRPEMCIRTVNQGGFVVMFI